MFQASQTWTGACGLALLLVGLCACGGSKPADEQAPAQTEGQSSGGDAHEGSDEPHEQRVPAKNEDKRDPRDVVPVLPIAPP